MELKPMTMWGWGATWDSDLPPCGRGVLHGTQTYDLVGVECCMGLKPRTLWVWGATCDKPMTLYVLGGTRDSNLRPCGCGVLHETENLLTCGCGVLHGTENLWPCGCWVLPGTQTYDLVYLGWCKGFKPKTLWVWSTTWNSKLCGVGCYMGLKPMTLLVWGAMWYSNQGSSGCLVLRETQTYDRVSVLHARLTYDLVGMRCHMRLKPMTLGVASLCELPAHILRCHQAPLMCTSPVSRAYRPGAQSCTSTTPTSPHPVPRARGACWCCDSATPWFPTASPSGWRTSPPVSPHRTSAAPPAILLPCRSLCPWANATLRDVWW